jgi:single-strand DNA-binding protein
MTEPSVSFAGNLTDDPEVRYIDSGIARGHVLGGRLQAPGAGGVVLHRGRLARPGRARRAVPGQGSRVVVVGRLQQRSWTAEDGSARSVVEVVRDHLDEIRDEIGYSVPAGVADEIASLVERLR